MKFFNFLKILSNELRSGVHLPSRNSSTVFFGIESIMNPGANLWNVVPQNIKTFDRSMFSNLKSNTRHQIIVHAEFAKPASAKLVL